jgi:hypothetical protein
MRACSNRHAGGEKGGIRGEWTAQQKGAPVADLRQETCACFLNRAGSV